MKWPFNSPPRQRLIARKRQGHWFRHSYVNWDQSHKHSIRDWFLDRKLRIEDWAWERKLNRAIKKGNEDRILFEAYIEEIFQNWKKKRHEETNSYSSDESPSKMVTRMEGELFGPTGWSFESSSYESYEEPSSSYRKQPEVGTAWTFEAKESSPYWTVRKRKV